MKKKPIVHAFFLCYNEANILPHLLKHYLSFCEHVTILDNNSSDNSVEIVNSFQNTDIIPWDSNDKLNDDLYIKLKNHVWKSSIGYADYVIVGDADEFLYHENMIDFLIECKEKGVTLLRPEGYHMVADADFILKESDNLIDVVKNGVRADVLDKPMMFDCNKITNINYTFGCHSASPTGDVRVFKDSSFKMLHYKFLGLEDHKYKQKIRGNRLSDFNKNNGLGLYYLFNEQEQINDYMGYLNKREKVL
jgi:glycosyltransferase involved in cell wall biosynthesis